MYLFMRSRAFVAKSCDGGERVCMVVWDEYLAHSHVNCSSVMVT